MHHGKWERGSKLRLQRSTQSIAARAVLAKRGVKECAGRHFLSGTLHTPLKLPAHTAGIQRAGTEGLKSHSALTAALSHQAVTNTS